MDEVLHLSLQSPPLELGGDQFVGAHVWTVGVVCQLFLQKHTNIRNSRSSFDAKLTHFRFFKGEGEGGAPASPVPGALDPSSLI